MKTSKFNFCAATNWETYLLFNGISGALYEVNSDERTSITNTMRDIGKDIKTEASDLFDALLDGGFIREDEIDEVEYLIERNRF